MIRIAAVVAAIVLAPAFVAFDARWPLAAFMAAVAIAAVAAEALRRKGC